MKRKIIKKIVFINLLLMINMLFGCSINRESNKFNLLSKNIHQLPVSIIWKIPVGNGIGKYYSRLSIDYNDNIVYAADRKGIIKAIDIDLKKELWITDLLSEKRKNLFFYRSSELLSGGLTVFNDIIYVGQEIGTVTALDKNSGKILWESNVFGEAISKPVVIDGLVLIHTNNGIFQALNAYTGQHKWSINLDHNQFSIRGKSSPVIYHDLAILGGSNGRISAIKYKTGEVIWHKYISKIIENNEIDRLHDINITPVIDEKNIFAIAYNGNLAAINLISHNIIWSINVGSVNDLVVKSDSIYVVDQNDCILKIRKSDGFLIWKYNLLMHYSLTAPVISGDYLIVGDKNGYLYWLNINNGILIFKCKINESGFLNKPILVSKNKLLIQGINGILYYISY